MTSTLDINAQSRKVATVLKDHYLRVPTNQRNYAWERKHVSELFSDLKLAIGHNAEEYFLGSIVLMGGEDGGSFVADGQQRLATIMILIAAIRDYHQKLEDTDSADKLHGRYLVTEEYGEAEPVPHLRLNERDHEYFYRRVLLRADDPLRNEEFITKPHVKSHKLIDSAAKEAAKAIKAIVQGLRPEQYFDELSRWVKFLREKTIIVVVSVPDESAAYTIFETMNDRGLALSAVDLIKNYLFGRASTSFDSVKHNWTTMLGALDTVKEDDVTSNFVRHYWISQYGTTRGPQLFNAIKKKIVSPAKVTEFSVGLSHASQKYIALLTPSHPYWASFGIYTTEIRKNLEVLNLFGIKQSRPLLLSAVDKFSHKDMANITHLAVAWTVRLIVSKTQGSGELETIYGDAAYQTREGTLKTVAQIAKFMGRAVPNDSDFQFEFVTTEVRQANIARYFLRTLERQHQNDPQAAQIPSDEAVITLEHVIPKDFSVYHGEWGYMSEEQHEELLNRLGNQVLLNEADNRAIGSRGYEYKKEFLANSDFALTSMAGNFENWGSIEVRERGYQLSLLAKQAWPLTLKHQ